MSWQQGSLVRNCDMVLCPPDLGNAIMQDPFRTVCLRTDYTIHSCAAIIGPHIYIAIHKWTIIRLSSRSSQTTMDKDAPQSVQYCTENTRAIAWIGGVRQVAIINIPQSVLR